MIGQLTNNVETDYWLNAAVAAGVDGATVVSSAIDVSGYDRVRVLLFIGGTAASTGTVKFFLTDSTTSGGAYTAISGATIGTHTHAASGETGKIYAIDTQLTPGKNFIKVNYQREVANTAFLCGIIEEYMGKLTPTVRNANIKEQVVA